MNQLELLDKGIGDDSGAHDGKDDKPGKKQKTEAAAAVDRVEGSIAAGSAPASGIKTTQGTVLYTNCNIITGHSLTLGNSSIRATEGFDVKSLVHHINNSAKNVVNDSAKEDEEDEEKDEE